MKNQTVTMQWIDVDGVENMPIGVYFVCMRDCNGLQEYGVCEVVIDGQGKYAHKVGVINGQFYFEFPPIVAYMVIPDYVPIQDGKRRCPHCGSTDIGMARDDLFCFCCRRFLVE